MEARKNEKKNHYWNWTKHPVTFEKTWPTSLLPRNKTFIKMFIGSLKSKLIIPTVRNKSTSWFIFSPVDCRISADWLEESSWGQTHPSLADRQRVCVHKRIYNKVVTFFNFIKWPFLHKIHTGTFIINDINLCWYILIIHVYKWFFVHVADK